MSTAIMQTACGCRRYVDAVGVVPPGPPVSLNTGEWADACARSSRFFGSKEWAEADQDFMRRHDGATLIQHNSGVLVGAFYIAPSWDNADSAVQVFSTLRRLMEDRP